MQHYQSHQNLLTEASFTPAPASKQLALSQTRPTPSRRLVRLYGVGRLYYHGLYERVDDLMRRAKNRPSLAAADLGLLTASLYDRLTVDENPQGQVSAKTHLSHLWHTKRELRTLNAMVLASRNMPEDPELLSYASALGQFACQSMADFLAEEKCSLGW